METHVTADTAAQTRPDGAVRVPQCAAVHYHDEWSMGTQIAGRARVLHWTVRREVSVSGSRIDVLLEHGQVQAIVELKHRPDARALEHGLRQLAIQREAFPLARPFLVAQDFIEVEAAYDTPIDVDGVTVATAEWFLRWLREVELQDPGPVPIEELFRLSLVAGLRLEVTPANTLRASGPASSKQILVELKARRGEVLELLTRCSVCGSAEVVLRADVDGLPFCRPCAQAEGTKLLRAEHPDWYLPGGRFARRSAA